MTATELFFYGGIALMGRRHCWLWAPLSSFALLDGDCGPVWNRNTEKAALRR